MWYVSSTNGWYCSSSTIFEEIAWWELRLDPFKSSEWGVWSGFLRRPKIKRLDVHWMILTRNTGTG